VDEGVREAEEELAFARAQMTETELDGFRAGIDDAKKQLRRAFELRQILDDSTPDPPEVVRETLAGLITEGEAARDELARQFEAMNARRDYERDAPGRLLRLSDDLAALNVRLPATARAMEGLSTQAASGWRSVAGNLDEARKRATLAEESIARGKLGATTDRPSAAREARTAQQALAEAAVMLDAVDNLAQQLVEARSGLAMRLAEGERSMLAASQAAAREGRSLPELQEIRSRLEEARRLSAATPPDLLAAYQLARHADASADELVASLQTATIERDRAGVAADLEMDAARAEYARAADYIDARRGSVGSEARTRLAEAERQLDSAQSVRPSDPAKTLEHARLASDLAIEAYSLASDDFDENETWGGMSGGALPGMIILGGLGGMLGGGVFGGMGCRRGGGVGGGGRSLGGMLADWAAALAADDGRDFTGPPV